MLVKILTPEAVIFEGDVDSVMVPGINGDFHIMKHHAAIVSALKAGKIRIFTDDLNEVYAPNFEAETETEFTYSMKSGVVEFNHDRGMILCEE